MQDRIAAVVGTTPSVLVQECRRSDEDCCYLGIVTTAACRKSAIPVEGFCTNASFGCPDRTQPSML